MTPGDRSAAQAALNEGRGVYGRLDQIRGPEDAAADILDLWGAAESAMRAMLGGSTLTDQALVRELRQRGVLNLEQANTMASFWDARSRVDDVGYKPTLTDVGYARVGYNELARALADSSSVGVGTAAAAAASPYSGQAVPPAPPIAPPAPPTRYGGAPIPLAAEGVPVGARMRGRGASPILIGGLVLLVLVLGILAYMTMGRSSYTGDMQTAVDLMQRGQVEAARVAFNKVARDNPKESTPHVYLARLARTDNDPNTARQELATAIRLDPADEKAQREMGLLLLSQNDPQLARNFLIRAVKLAPNDSAAQGYLGCALLRLNRIEEGQRFLSRAGSGSWSSCTAVPPPVPAPR